MPSRIIHDQSFNLPAGGATTLTSLNPIDLSYAQALLCELDLTTIGTDVGDTLDVKIQDVFTDRRGTLVWNTRARFPLVTGNTAAPRTYRLNLEQAVAIAQSEQGYEDTTDAGVSEIGSGTVRNGPFPGIMRLASPVALFTGGPALNRAASWRVSMTTVDAGTQNGTWIGRVVIAAYDAVRW